MRDLLGHPSLMYGSNRISASHNRRRIFIRGYCLRDFLCPSSERGSFKNSHWSVPDNRARVCDLVGIQMYRLRTNIESHVAFGNWLRGVNGLCRNVVLDLHRDHVVDRQKKTDVSLL